MRAWWVVQRVLLHVDHEGRKEACNVPVQDAVANVGCQHASVAEGNARCMNIYGGRENTEKQKVR